MKKRLIFLLFILGLVIGTGFVSAQNFDGILRGMENGIGFLFGDVGGGGGEIAFIKLMVFLLLFAVINTVLRRVPQFRERVGIVFLISIVVAIISVRYMTSENLINFIWLPYGTLGVMISVLLPFIIGFYFIEGFDSSVLRKIAWSAFAVIFVALAYFRWPDFAAQTASGIKFNLAWLYVAIAVLSGLLMLFDRNIRARMFKGSLMRGGDRKKRIQAAKIAQEIEELRGDLSRTDDPKVRSDIRQEIDIRKGVLNDLLKS